MNVVVKNKNMKLDYLDLLYRWKIEAEIELEKLEEESEDVDTEELVIHRLERRLTLEHAQKTVNRYRSTITAYVAYHNN